MKRSGTPMLVLYMASGALQASLNMILLAFPIYALAVSASPFEIGLIGAVGGLTYSLMARFLGGISDRFSKRLFVISGAVIQAVVSVMYPFCRATTQLFPLRIVQALGAALTWPAIESMVAANASDNAMESALAGFNISWGAANIVSSPLAGFLITAFFLTLPFYVSSAFAILVSLMLLPFRSGVEANSLQTETRVITSTEVTTRFILFLPTVATFTYAFGSGIVGTLFPVTATLFGFTAFQIGLLFFLSNLVQMLVFVFSARLIQKFGRGSFLIGALAFTVSMSLMAFVKDVVAFVPSFLCLGLGQGILYSASLYYLLMGSGKNKGHATGSFESTLGLAFFLGPLLGGAIAQFGPSYPYVAGAIVSLFIVFVKLFLRERS